MSPPIFYFLLGSCCYINSYAIEYHFKYNEVIENFEFNTAKIGELVRRVEARPRVNDVAINPEGTILAVGTEKGELNLWDLTGERREIKRLKGHSGNIVSTKFSRDGQWLASAGLDDKKILLWNVKDWTIVREFKEEAQTIFSIAFSADSQYLAGGYDNRLIVWEVSTGKVVNTFSEHMLGISGIAFSPDNKWLASASWDHFVRVWEWQQRETKETPLHRLKHEDSVFFIDFSPDSRWLASGGDDRIVWLWDVKQGKEINRFIKHKSWIVSVMFSADGRWLISSAENGRIEIQDLKNNQSTDLTLNELITRMSVHPKKNQFVGASVANGSIRLYDIESKKLLSLLVIGNRENDWLSCDFTKENCLRSRPWIDWFLQFAIVWIVLAFIMTIVVYYYYRIYRHPLVVSVATNPHLLLDLPLTQLPGIKRLLRLSGRFKFVLVGCHLLPVDIENAISFIKSLPATQAKILAEKLEATLEPQTPDLFILRLSDSFPINLKDCFLYFPSTNTPTSAILNKLNWDDKFISQKVIIITLNPLQQRILRPHGEDATSLFIVPNLNELTRWLLAPQPLMECARTIANQLKVIQLSPYQVAGGVDRESNFFGREQILAHIFNRNLANYIVVGGRQIGKTSLLKHLLRYYRSQPDLQCHFLSLSNHELLGKLAISLQLPAHSRIEEIEHYLRSGQHHVFLIDEADRFIQAEMQRGYTLLNHIRGLSEEGHCCFFLAGFWQLYQSAILDYHSPLKNFAETITVAELEREACHDLIVKPLYSLNIKIASEELIEQIIYLTGQRANLIALVCHEMLKNLDLTTRVLDEVDVMRALESKAVNESIEGWKNLTADEELNRLDRLIVYSTIREGQFSLTPLLNRLESYGSYYPPQQVEQSLARLTLSFVIQRPSHHYTYCVPLLRKQLLQEDLDELIKWELK